MQLPEAPNAVLRAAAVGRVLGVHRQTIGTWWRRGWLPYRCLPNGTRFMFGADLRDWIESRHARRLLRAV